MISFVEEKKRKETKKALQDFHGLLGDLDLQKLIWYTKVSLRNQLAEHSFSKEQVVFLFRFLIDHFEIRSAHLDYLDAFKNPHELVRSDLGPKQKSEENNFPAVFENLQRILAVKGLSFKEALLIIRNIIECYPLTRNIIAS